MGISRKARRELTWILLLLSCMGFCGFVLFGEGGFLKLRSYRQDLERLKKENIRLLKAQKTLSDRIESLKSDPYEIERIARERFQLARPGDIIVNVP